MKTCPLLWRQTEAWGSSLLEKSVDLDERACGRGYETGAPSDCLGPACRFCLEDGNCLFERIGKLVTGEQIAEGLQLATATLTDEIRAALDCTAGPLQAIEKKLGEAPSADPAATAQVQAAVTELSSQFTADFNSLRDQLVSRLGESAEQAAARQIEAATQLGDLTERLAESTGGIDGQLRRLVDEVAAAREDRQRADTADASWRAQLQRHLDDSEEKWENMFLSLTELTDRMESALQTIQEHIAQENQRRERSEKEAQLAAAKRENNAGVVHYHSGDMERARARFIRAIALAPDFVEAYNNLGLVETELGNAEEATRNFQKAIELDPDLSASYNNLGYVFFLQQNYEEAIAMYEEAIARTESSSAAWTNLGNAHFKLGDLERARAAWEKALAFDPGNKKAADNLQRLLQPATG